MKTRQDIQNLLNKLPHTIQVTFALHCCNDIKHLITDPISLKALEVVEKWLHNPASVTTQELYDAASSASAASASAANAAYSASPTSASAYAASSASASASASAANAAYSAYSAAYSASASSASGASAYAAAYAYSAYSAAYASAASAAYSAANASYKLNDYYNDLIKMVQELTKLEKVLIFTKEQLNIIEREKI